MKKIILIILSLAFLGILGCGNEGVTEGMIDGIPIRFTDKDVKAVQGIPPGMSVPMMNQQTAALPMMGVPLQQGITVYVGDDLDTSKFRYRLTIFMYDVSLALQQPTQQVPMNVVAKFDYVLNGETKSQQATYGTVIFDEIGYFAGEYVSGEFNLQFGLYGTLLGQFRTRIGVSR